MKSSVSRGGGGKSPSKTLTSLLLWFMVSTHYLQAQSSPEFCQPPAAPLNVALGCGHPCFTGIDPQDIPSFPTATIALDFHFIADASGNNFHCDPNGDPKFYAPTIVQQIIDRANLFFSDPDINAFGSSPKVPDARIRYELYGNPATACDVISFYNNNQSAVFSNANAFHIVIKDGDPDAGISGELGSANHMNLVNIPRAFFLNGATDAGAWGAIMNHEIGHRFGLCHSFSANNTCQDMSPAEECGGVSETVCTVDGVTTPCPPSPPNAPYPLSCEGNRCFGCYCTWGTGNNFMGANGSFRGMTVSQWATMYGSMLSENPVFARFDNMECADIPVHPPLEIPENTVVEWDAFRILDQHVEVRKGATLIIRCEVRVGKDLHIIVNQGARLFVLGGRITSKSDDCRWGGIVVHGNSAMEQPSAAVAKDPSIPLHEHSAGVLWLNGAILENAHTAVSTRGTGGLNTPAYYGGLVLAYDTDFVNNDRAVEFMKYGKANKSIFEYCTFEKGAAPVPYPVRRGVSIWACTGIKFRHSNFRDLSDSAISGYDYSAEVETCEFKGSEYAYRVEVTMPNVSQGITTIQNSTFRNNRFHIYCNASPNYLYGYNIFGNTFLNGQLFGIRIGGEAQYSIKQSNIFQNHLVAVMLIGTGVRFNEVTCNIFETHSPMGLNVRFNNDNLRILANNFLGSSGISMRLEGNNNNKGTIYPLQGNSLVAASNYFAKPANAIVTTQGGTTHFTYYTLPETNPLFTSNLLPTNNLSDGGTNNYGVQKISQNLHQCPSPIQPTDPPTESDLFSARQNTAVLKAAWQADNLNWDKYLAYMDVAAHQEDVLRHVVYHAWLSDSIEHAENLLLGEGTNLAIRGVVGLRVQRGYLAGAQALLDSMPIENQDDQWFKNIMVINMGIAQAGSGNFDLSASQEQLLHTIADNEHSLMRGYACALLSQWRGYTCQEALSEHTPDIEERTVSDNAALLRPVRIYPNPSGGDFFIDLPDYIGEPIRMELVNTAGQLVQHLHFSNNGNATLQTEGMPNGTYWLRLSHSSRVLFSGKIVILR